MTGETKTSRIFVRSAIRMAAIILVLALIISYATGHGRLNISIAAGFIVAVISFVILTFVILRTLTGRSALLVAFFGIIKMGIIGALLWWLLSRGIVEPFSFLIGFTTIVMALIVEALRIR